MRNKRNPMSTYADEGVHKTANGGGSYTADHFNQVNAPPNLNHGAFDIHRGQNFMGDVIDGENVHRLAAGKDGKMTGIETATNVPTFIASGRNAIDDTNGWNGVVGHGRRRSSLGVAKRPILPPLLSFRSSYVDHEESVNQEFGRNTNRLDYFRVDPFDVYEDHLPRVGSFGGGGGPRQEYEGGGDSHVSHVTGGGMRIRRVPVGVSANDGGEGVVERLDHGGGNEGGGGSREIVGRRLEQERGSGASAGSGDGTREVVPVGTFGDNCGETVVQKLKQEGATVAVPVVVVAVAVAVMVVMMMVMVMVMVMVVLVSVMAKMESRR
ncbi:hypothetical protein LXL04_017111 [Taraxacum kok-saghyz]